MVLALSILPSSFMSNAAALSRNWRCSVYATTAPTPATTASAISNPRNQ